MADKKLNEVTKVTDMAYVPVIMADGSIGQIAKADLASVVAGVINSDTMLKNKMLSSFQVDKASGSFNDLLTGGMYYTSADVTDGPTGVSGSGLVITLGTLSNYRFQIFSPASSQHYYARKYIYSAWTAWAKISV